MGGSGAAPTLPRATHKSPAWRGTGCQSPLFPAGWASVGATAPHPHFGVPHTVPPVLEPSPLPGWRYHPWGGPSIHPLPRGLASPSCSLFPWNHIPREHGTDPAPPPGAAGGTLTRSVLHSGSRARARSCLTGAAHARLEARPSPFLAEPSPRGCNRPDTGSVSQVAPGTGWWCQRRAVASHRGPRAELRSLPRTPLCHRGHSALSRHSQPGNCRAGDSGSQTARGI